MTFKYTFKTQDGNTQAVFVYAHSSMEADRVFETEYEYSELLSQEEVDE